MAANPSLQFLEQGIPWRTERGFWGCFGGLECQTWGGDVSWCIPIFQIQLEKIPELPAPALNPAEELFKLRLKGFFRDEFFRMTLGGSFPKYFLVWSCFLEFSPHFQSCCTDPATFQSLKPVQKCLKFILKIQISPRDPSGSFLLCPKQ